MTTSAVVVGTLCAVALLVLGGLVRTATQVTQRSRLARRLGKRSSRARIGVVVVPLVLATAVWGPVAAAALAIAMAGVPMIVAKLRQNRRDKQYDIDLPVYLDEVARRMRSGFGLANAIADVANTNAASDVGQDLKAVTQRNKLGMPLAESLAVWSQERQRQSVARVGSSLSIALETGAAQAQVIDGVSMSLRQSLNARASARTHATQSRASAWVLSCLPLCFTGPMVLVDASVRSFLFGTWIGVMVLVVGLALNGLGAWWMKRLIGQVS